MLTITVTLVHGTIRTGSPDDTVLAGWPSGEWPPSPARLFSALVAADGTGDRCRVTTGEELAWLECLDPPVVYASATADVLQSPLRDRFVVVDETTSKSGAVQDYPAREARAVRRGVRLSPANPTVVYVWADALPSPQQRAALQARAQRIGYLGCSDSPVEVSVGAVPAVGRTDTWVPDEAANFALPVPYPGFLKALDIAYTQWTSGGAMRRPWVRSLRVGYRSPGQIARPDAVARPVVMWLRFDRAVEGRKLVAVTETLRKAVLDHLQRAHPDLELPAVLHGHRPLGREGPQARFLALPDVGHHRAQGRLLGAAVWLPSGSDPQLVQQVRTALGRLTGGRLTRPGWFDVAVELYGGEQRPWAVNPRRWEGPSRHWVSVTPVVHERWTKGAPDRAEVVRWCTHADLPSPVRFELGRDPWLPGALNLHPEQVNRPGRSERRPYSHALLEFAEPVTGPVVLGRGRQLGLGLMAPADWGVEGEVS